MKLAGKKALITGASSGLGQAIAIAFAKEGADIIFSYQSNDEGAAATQQQIQSLNRKCLAIKVALQDVEQLQKLMSQAENFLGEIDILVNNAGTLTRHPNFLDISADDFDLIQAVNVRAPFLLSQWATKQMIKQGRGGSIIHISSASAEVTSVGLAHYECSKAAINRLTKTMASELAPYHIRVNAIAPGLFATNINSHQHQSNTKIWQERCARIPMKKAGEPHQISALAVLLASDDGELMTGDIITIDGGISINSFLR